MIRTRHSLPRIARAAIGVALLVGAAFSTHLRAAVNDWTGEWGAFTHTPRAGHAAARDEGAGLSISDCSGNECKVSFEIIGATFHAEATADLQIENDMQAIAHLRAPNGDEKCTLMLTKTETKRPAIAARLLAGDCSYFETPGASFEHTYPLRSMARFYAADLPACFVGASRSVVALCASQALSQQERDWTSLLWQVSDLRQPPLDKNAEEAEILRSCDTSANVGDCLARAFSQSTHDLVARQDAWKTSITDPGNAAEAQRAIEAIEGTYRHSFGNGDVRGDKFTSTDTLQIHRASATSIRVNVHLAFYNGHECNHHGIASYRRAHLFAEKVTEYHGKVCVFEVIPTPAGVRLADPTGMCRMDDCGARGGYNGAAFSSSEKVKPPAADQKPHETR